MGTPVESQDYDGAADALGCWQDGTACKRLEHVIGEAFVSYIAAQRETPDLTVRRHIARELIRQHAGVLDAVGGGK